MRQLRHATIVGRVSNEVWVGTGCFGCGRTEGEVEEVGVVVRVESEIQSGGARVVGERVLLRVRESCGEGRVMNREVLEALRDELVGGGVGVKMELVLVGRGRERVCLVLGGGGMVGLYREGRLGLVADGRRGKVGVEGRLAVNDVLIAGSESFFGQLSSGELRGVLEKQVGFGGGVEGVAEELVLLTYRRQDSRGAVGLVLGDEEVEEGVMFGEIDDKIEGKGWRRRLDWRHWWKPGGIKIRTRGEISEKERRRRKVGAVVFGVMMVVLVGSVGLGWRKRMGVERAEALEAVLAPAETLMSQAQVEMGVNRLRARALLVEAIGVLEEGVGEFDEGTDERNRVGEILERARAEYVLVSGEKEVELRVYLDPDLVREGMRAERISSNGERLVVADLVNRNVVAVEVESKRAGLVAGGEVLSGLRLVGSSSTHGYGLVESGIVRFGWSEEGVSLVVNRDEEWRAVVSMEAFGSGVYVLDKEANEIWRYVLSSGEGAVRSRWLATGVNPDFSQVVDMKIDGSIWVLDETGVVREYSRGASTGFRVMEWGDEIGEAKSLFITENGVYVLDRGGRRVVVFDKQGEYLRQYKSEQLVTASDMAVVVNEEGRDELVLVVEGGVIYEIELEG